MSGELGSGQAVSEMVEPCVAPPPPPSPPPPSSPSGMTAPEDWVVALVVMAAGLAILCSGFCLHFVGRSKRARRGIQPHSDEALVATIKCMLGCLSSHATSPEIVMQAVYCLHARRDLLAQERLPRGDGEDWLPLARRIAAACAHRLLLLVDVPGSAHLEVDGGITGAIVAKNVQAHAGALGVRADVQVQATPVTLEPDRADAERFGSSGDAGETARERAPAAALPTPHLRRICTPPLVSASPLTSGRARPCHLAVQLPPAQQIPTASVSTLPPLAGPPLDRLPLDRRKLQPLSGDDAREDDAYALTRLCVTITCDPEALDRLQQALAAKLTAPGLTLVNRDSASQFFGVEVTEAYLPQRG